MALRLGCLLLLAAFTACISAIPVDDETVQSLLNDFYFPKTKLNPKDLELTKVYTSKTWKGLNYQYYFNVVGTQQTCVVIIYNGWIAGPEREILKDTCITLKKVASLRSVDYDEEGSEEISKDNEVAQSLLKDFYFPKTKINPKDLELTRVFTSDTWDDWDGLNYRYYFNVVGSQNTCKVFIYYGWMDFEDDFRGGILEDTCSKLTGVPSIRSVNPDDKKDDATAQSLLNDFYFPKTKMNPEDLELTKVYTSKTWKGLNYKYYFNVVGSQQTCVVIIYNGWIAGPEREILEDTCITLKTGRSIRAAMPGGWVQQDKNNADYLGILDNLYFFTNAGVKSEQLEIRRIETQVVAGINIKYTFNVVGSNAVCQIVINKQWNMDMSILSDSCKEAVNLKREVPMPGGWLQQDKDNSDYLGYLDNLYFFTNAGVKREQLAIHSIETQVVSGINIRYTFNVVGSNAVCQIVINRHWSMDMSILSDSCKEAVNLKREASMVE